MNLPSPVQRVIEGYRHAYGAEPDGVWSAPGRVNLIGEHTDYNQGFVLPMAIDRRTWVAVGRRPDRTARVASAAAPGVVEHPVDAIGPDTVCGWSAYPLGTAWGVIDVAVDQLESICGFDAFFVSDIPMGAGLSSSAAFECSLATALSDLWQLDLDGDELLRATRLAENVVVGAPTGILDQCASLFARPGQALFIDCRDTCVQPIPLDLWREGLSLVVVDTRVRHAHADGAYAARRASCELAARLLGVPALRDLTPEGLEAGRDSLEDVTYRRARHVVTENARVRQVVDRLHAEGPRAIADLLVASHRSMRKDFEITIPELDLAVAAAVDAGALGARMTGGGFGGSAIALVNSARIVELAASVRSAFAAHGFRPPSVFPVSASGGARREIDAEPSAGHQRTQ